jgi:hypothetical protein
MFLVAPTFVVRCHYVRKDARDPDGKIWNCKLEGWPIKGVTSFVRYAVRDFYMQYPRVRHIHVNKPKEKKYRTKKRKEAMSRLTLGEVDKYKLVPRT